ncbi:MAG: sigma-70 family RNA polymerase sigma factor [Methylococcaceae bacterium]|nr:sigma-70 family RNA polymerase sigma factor [Methylococcaceae bacterium]
MSASALDIQSLFTRHRGELLWHLLKIVKCEETAAELAQESYLILVESAGKQTIEQPRSFLFKVATNLALNHLRRNKVAEVNSPYLEITEHATPSAEHTAEQTQRFERFIGMIDAMPPRSREIFLLHKVHGMPLKQVAAELGITVKAVEKHVTKGMALCRERLLMPDED